MRLLLAVTAVLGILFVATTGGLYWYHDQWVTGQANPFVLPRAGHLLLLQGTLAHENNVATWYSAMLMLLVAFTSLLCFGVDQQPGGSRRTRVAGWGWVGLAGMFALLSFDEIGSFHETIGDTAVFAAVGRGSGWTAFLVLLAGVGAAIGCFGVLHLRRHPVALALLVVGTLLFLSNPYQEKLEIDAYRAAADPATWQRPLGLLLLEEGSELLATWCFLCATVVYSAGRPHRGRLDRPEDPAGLAIRLAYSPHGATLGVGLVAAMLALLLTQVAGQQIAPGMGIPKNWFPSAGAFGLFVFSLYQFSRGGRAKAGHAVLAACSLGISVFYGSDLYSAPVLWREGSAAGYALRLLLAGLCGGLALLLWRGQRLTRLQTATLGLGLTGWAAALWFPQEQAALVAFGGAVGLALALVPNSFLPASVPAEMTQQAEPFVQQEAPVRKNPAGASAAAGGI
ncbi:hypothetical protein [Hymenobacter arizonensis]|uniref:hypothetical protein n=1 Tax=Hymenobacter arizonensis TaxID=1227077 RepID=UPI000B8150F3|nr:hypothetical protein [Hymenobacter arizonensis]